jgi:hypothetical protein
MGCSGKVRKKLRFPVEFNGGPIGPPPAETEKDFSQRIGIIDVDFVLTD